MGRAEEARRLRSEEELSIAQIRERLGASKDQVQQWLQGMAVPEWTKRPNAKDGLRAEAVQLRLEGMSVPKIAEALGVARSTAFQWTKHIPLDGSDEEKVARRKAHSKAMTDARWSGHRVQRDEDRERLTTAAARSIGGLSKREVLLLGAAVYWCEGEKEKKWRPHAYAVSFINSDPCLIQLFLNFVEQLGYRREELSYRLSIHETANMKPVDGGAIRSAYSSNFSVASTSSATILSPSGITQAMITTAASWSMCRKGVACTGV